jgi:methanogenic corrinoid protein MtbC1
VATLRREALEELITESGDDMGARESSAAVVGRLLEAIEAHEFDRFEQLLGWVSASLAPRELISHVVGPILTEVGNLWHDGRLTIAQEHTVSAIVRNLMGSIIRLYPRRGESGGVLFATISGERHEFGILMLHMLASSQGIPSHFLGPDVPAEEVARAAAETQSRLVALSAVNHADEDQLREYRRLGDLASIHHYQIVMGGASAGAVLEKLGVTPIQWVRNVEEFERHLRMLQT